MPVKEFERHAREKREEGRRIEEGEAHQVPDSERRTAQDIKAARAGMRQGRRDLPPDAEGQDRAGRIEQTTTSKGYTQSR